MATDDRGVNQEDSPQGGLLSRNIFSTDHKTIGLNYLWLALFSVFLGMAMSLLMRIHLVWPGVHLPLFSRLGDSPDRFAALTTLHGSLMVFLVLTAAPQAGFGNYFLPLQIGAREMAFPRLNLLAYWATVASLLGMTTTFLIPSHPAITLWIVSVSIFCGASLLNALNFSVTTIDLRGQGMTLPRLPLTVWAWFINAILGMLIFSILLAACVCLLSDRLLGTHFFSLLSFIANQPPGVIANALPVLWQRLFWFFAQAEVYVAMLPCFGLVTHLISTFSRKPVWKERLVVLALCGVGVFGFCVWGEHMFSSFWRALGDFPGAARSGRRCGERRFRDRAFPSGDGRGGDVRDSWRTVFLVSENVRSPLERIIGEDSFLADVCRRLLRFYAHALARADGAFSGSLDERVDFCRCRWFGDS